MKESADEQNLSFGDLWSSAEAGKAGLILLGDSAEDFNSTLAQMRESTGATESAFEKLQTNSSKINKAVNAVKIPLSFGWRDSGYILPSHRRSYRRNTKTMRMDFFFAFGNTGHNRCYRHAYSRRRAFACCVGNIDDKYRLSCTKD